MWMIRLSLVLIIPLLISSKILAQKEGVITIINETTFEPVEFVSVSSKSPRAFVTTDLEGRADISNFEGSSEIIFRIIGYKTDTLSYQQIVERGFIVKLLASEYQLGQFQVYAPYATRAQPDIGAKTIQISTGEIIRLNPQTTADLVGNTGEVFVQKSQMGGGSPMIRGFATNRLLLTVDGVRMNTAIFRSGNLQNIISLDAYSTASADIIFGPSSVMYGSDALGGVIGFKTLQPNLSREGKSSFNGTYATRYSTANNEVTNHLDFNIGFKKTAFLSSITYSDFGDLRMGTDGPKSYLRNYYADRQNGEDVILKNDDPLVQKPTAYSQLNLMQKVHHEFNSNWSANYGFHYSTTSNTPRYDRLIRFKEGLPRSAEWEYGPQIWMMNHLEVKHIHNYALAEKITLSLAQQRFEESRMDRDFGEDILYKRLEMVDAYSMNLDFEKRIGGRHVYFYGLEAVFNEVNSEGRDENIITGINKDAASRYPQSNWTSMGIYAAYQHHFTDELKVEAGLRYNQFLLNASFDTSKFSLPFDKAEVNNGAFSGSLGMFYDLNSNNAIRINLSTGFRAPNVDDIGKVFDSEPGAVVVPNPNLDAEYVYSGEVGYNKKINKLALNLSGYYTILENAMVRRSFTLNGADSIKYDGELSQVQAIQNAARSYIYGMNLGIHLVINKFKFSNTINYQKGEEELDDGSISAARHVAPWFGNTHLLYATKKLKYDLYLNYSGEIGYQDLAVEERGKPYLYATNEDGNPYSPGWYTLNFNVSAQVSTRLILVLGLENITDQRYKTYSSGIAAAGRNFFASVRASF